ncbi:MAG: futalosine hydrolase [Bacteroidetes bacterium]|nr:futalosine hydrolase [Bacteroidota bacterium]
MKILIVSATQLEIQLLLSELGNGKELKSNFKRYDFNNHVVDILITGVGMVVTAFWTAKVINSEKYDCAINLGICGSFNRSIALGELLNITSDCIPELGSETADGFLSLADMNLVSPDFFPFQGGKLINPKNHLFSLVDSLPEVNAVSVNTIHGESVQIGKFIKHSDADIETMEGAAFFYACFQEQLPCVQLRAVSNYVEARDTSKWDIKLAVAKLNQFVIEMLKKL